MNSSPEKACVARHNKQFAGAEARRYMEEGGGGAGTCVGGEHAEGSGKPTDVPIADGDGHSSIQE